MYQYTLFTVVLFSQLFSGYAVGDTITIDDQLMKFSYCYPSDSSAVIDPLTGDTIKVASTFSFAQHNGDLNGGNYQVLMIEVSASW